MDFTLALTHFCEVHGPKSVLCTQVLPLECRLCEPPSPPLRAKTSCESCNTQIFQDNATEKSKHVPFSRQTDGYARLSSGLSNTLSPTEERPVTPNIERHPLFRRPDSVKTSPRFPYGRASGETCASCSFSVPQKIAARLPEGAPGSLKEGGKKHGAPVLRSREFVCLGKSRKSSELHSTKHEPSSSQESQESQESGFSSVGSTPSQHEANDCHDHTLTYLTSKSPDDPDTYAILRSSVLRALSCEVLPKGLSEGPFCFGDSTTGYTIAYIFRLTDTKARGRRRAYAFVALAGNDAYRAFKACPMLWEAFATMAKIIELAAQRHQDEKELEQQKAHEQEMSKSGNSSYTNISSFLTQRPVDTDGNPRRVGQTTPRSLAEITGDENIFAILHQYFVAVLRCLGTQFGGLPLAEPKQEVAPGMEASVDTSKDSHRMSSDTLDALTLEEEEEEGKEKNTVASAVDVKDTTPTNVGSSTTGATSTLSNTISTTPTATELLRSPSTRSATPNKPQHIKRNSQCGTSLNVDSNRQRQVAV